MFRKTLLAVALLSIISSSIGLAIIWALAFIVDGVVASGATLFVSENFLLLCAFAVLIAAINPLVTFIEGCFSSQTIEVLLPAAMIWQAHKTVEKQDIAFFEDLYAGQVATKINQVTGSVQRQLNLAINQIPQTVIQFSGSLGLLAILAWPLAVPVVFWIVINILVAWFAIPLFIKKSEKVAAAESRAAGAMTDIYSNIMMVKAFSAESSESDSIRQIINDTIKTSHQESRFFLLIIAAVRMSNAALTLAIFTIGMWGMIEGFVSIGDFVAAVTVLRTLLMSSFAFIGLGTSVSRAVGPIRDAMPVITNKPKVCDKPGAMPLQLSTGEIKIDGVSYAYATTSESDGDGRWRK